jgi:hypothetical protein
MKIIGLLEFAPTLYVSADLLGGEYGIHIAGQRGTLFFPSLPAWGENETDPLRMNLVAPDRCATWRQGNEPVFWGSPTSFPSGESIVHRAFLEFDISGIHEAQSIYRDFTSWKNLLYQYIKLLTTQGTDSHIIVEHETRSLSLFQDSTHLSPIGDENNASISITMSEGDESLHRDQLMLSLEAASERKNLRIEYRLLLNALEARGKDDFRMAIIDAANAVELCLHSQIKEKCKALGIGFADELLKKYSMLGGKIELSKLLEILPKKDYVKIFSEPRNSVMHKAFFPEKEGATRMILAATKLLKEIQPEISE